MVQELSFSETPRRIESQSLYDKLTLVLYFLFDRDDHELTLKRLNTSTCI